MNPVVQVLIIIVLDLVIVGLALFVYGSIEAIRRGRRMQHAHLDSIANLQEQFKLSQERDKREMANRELRNQQLKNLKRQTH